MEEAVAPQVVALLAGLAQALVAELVLGLVLAPRVGTLRERTLQEVQVAQCKAPLAKVPTQEWAAMSAPRAPARPIPAQAQIPKSAGSSLECGLLNEPPEQIDGAAYSERMSDQDIARFRAQAEECRQQSERAISLLDKESWLRLPGEWIKLAQDAESVAVDGKAPSSPRKQILDDRV